MIDISAWENLLAILVTLGRGHTASKVLKILAYLHDKVRNQLYCSNGGVNWHGMKGSCFDRTLDPPCGLKLWPHVWSWHWSFRYSCSYLRYSCCFQERMIWNERAMNPNHYTVRCHYNTVNFGMNHHKIHPIARPLGRDMGCNVWFDTWLIFCFHQCRLYGTALEWHSAVLCVTLNLDLTHDWSLNFQGEILKIIISQESP